METLMEKGLQEIKAVSGVRGCWVCDNQGAVFANEKPNGMSQDTIEKINRQSLLALLAVERVQDASEELDLSYKDSRMLIRDYQQFLLVIVASPEANVSLVRLSANVVASQWEQDGEIQEKINSLDPRMEISGE